MVAIRFPLN